jgi:hypothetical protein
MKFGLICCLYDDHEYLDYVLPPFQKLDKVLIMVSDRPWNGEPSDNSRMIQHVKEICAVMPNFELVQGNWTTEKDQRNAGLTKLYKEGIDYTFIVDGDEIYHEGHVRNIMQFVQANPAVAAFHIEWNTFWTKKYYAITPRENFKPVVLVKTSSFMFTGLRQGPTEITRAGDHRQIHIIILLSRPRWLSATIFRMPGQMRPSNGRSRPFHMPLRLWMAGMRMSGRNGHRRVRICIRLLRCNIRGL